MRLDMDTKLFEADVFKGANPEDIKKRQDATKTAYIEKAKKFREKYPDQTYIDVDFKIDEYTCPVCGSENNDEYYESDEGDGWREETFECVDCGSTFEHFYETSSRYNLSRVRGLVGEE